MKRLISAEIFKLRKRSMTRILLFVLVGIMTLLYLLLLAISKANLPAGPAGRQMGNIQNLLGLPMALPFALSMLSSFGTVLAVILVASSSGFEYNWRTIRTMLISSESRFKLLAAKLISAAVFVLAGMVIGLAAGFLMSLITTVIGGYTYDFSFLTGDYVRQQFLQFWRTFFVLTPYMLLGFLFAIAGRSVMPGIALGIGVYFLESIITTFMNLAGGWIARIPDYLLSANVNAITALNELPRGFGGMGVGTTGDTAPSVTHAYITLGIYGLAFMALAFYFFRKRDVTG